MEKRISGHTGLLALIGSPVGHSGSPAMYNYSFEKLGLDYAYVAFDIKEDKVKDAIAAMKTFNMRGCNVTMPDKVEAAKYMDELSPAAQIIGAVNTIVNDNGKLTGHITDGEGFVHNLRDHGIEIKGKKITVAGGGGAATAIQVQCALDGAREISIFNIKDAFFERTLQTAEKIKKAVPECVVNVYDIADTAKMTEEIQSSDIFANATIVGMKPMDDQSVVKDLSAFRPGLVVADAVYNPEETKLLREAKEAGCIVSFDPNLRPPLWKSLDEAKAEIEYGLSKCDILKISDNEVEFLFGTTDYDEGARLIREKYQIPLVLITLGKDGSRAYYKDLRVEVPGFVQEHTIETTGAGDTFCANSLNYILEHGMEELAEENLKELLTFANAAASLITTRKGALRVMPTREEIKNFIQNV